jgi:hypothetical protein
MRVLGVIVCLSTAISTASAQEAPVVDGNWRCTVKCECGTAVHQSEQIFQSNDQIRLINHCGGEANGRFLGGQKFNVVGWPSDGSTPLTLSSDGKKLLFDNIGTIWER